MAKKGKMTTQEGVSETGIEILVLSVVMVLMGEWETANYL
jgi:hypothetical protein